jgi:hypothetical protein
MSSPEHKSRRRFLSGVALLPMLFGCSFSPIYGDGADSAAIGAGFAYAEPENRYEQIIYQELAFRLGTDPSSEAPLVTIKASKSTRRVGRTSPGSVLTMYEAVVSAYLTVDSRGAEAKRLLVLSRFAGASYEVSGQVAADRAAEQNASEQAARAVADSLRLLLAAACKKGEI